MDDEPRQPEEHVPAMPPPPAAETGPAAPPRGLSAEPVVRGPARPVSSRARLGGWIVLAGGAIAVASAFLPRITASAPGGEVTYGGLAGAGFGTLILAGFAIAEGLQVVRPEMVKMRLSSPVITGALMLLLAGIRFASLQSNVDDLQALTGVTASIGSGFWIGLIGASLVAIGGGLIRVADRAG
jgi:hypothetical protein